MVLHFISLGSAWTWIASRSGHFIPTERAKGTHWIGGWLGAGLDAVNIKLSCQCRKSNPDFSNFQLVAPSSYILSYINVNIILPPTPMPPGVLKP
jgi:hypothetical protein